MIKLKSFLNSQLPKMKLHLCIVFLAIALLFTPTQVDSRRRSRSKRNHPYCRPKTLVRYRMTIHTLWSRRTFPKMYPNYRPPAQWSAAIGASHSPDFTMWREGELATQGTKMFAETANPLEIQKETAQGYQNVLDAFTAPAIGRGLGQTSTMLFVDGHHTQVSFMMKMVPSPDWFVGVNGLDLCRRGRWRRKVHVNLRPMDAGTDQGMTFTSPNWPNDPVEPISAITSSFPNNEASSFFYPDYDVLPRIAFLDLELASEYRLRRSFVDTPHIEWPSPNSEPEVDESDLSGEEELAVKTDDTFGKASRLPPSKLSTTETRMHEAYHLAIDPFAAEPEKKISPNTFKDPQFVEVTRVEAEEQQELDHSDCVVSEWSDWSPCTQTCGFGKKERAREVVRHSMDYGAPCPLLRQEALCGSMRSCEWSHFSLFGKDKGSKKPMGLGIGNGMKRRRRKPRVGMYG